MHCRPTPVGTRMAIQANEFELALRQVSEYSGRFNDRNQIEANFRCWPSQGSAGNKLLAEYRPFGPA
jgi:hypothetical protein